MAAQEQIEDLFDAYFIDRLPHFEQRYQFYDLSDGKLRRKKFVYEIDTAKVSRGTGFYQSHENRFFSRKVVE